MLKEFLQINNNNFLSMSHMKQKFELWYNSMFATNISFHKNTYWRYLTSKLYLNFSYKRVSKSRGKPTNSQALMLEKLTFIKRFLYLIYKGYEPVFLDESDLV